MKRFTKLILTLITGFMFMAGANAQELFFSEYIEGGSNRKALLPQQIYSFFQITLGLPQGSLAIHHAGIGLVAQFFDHLAGNFHGMFSFQQK